MIWSNYFDGKTAPDLVECHRPFKQGAGHTYIHVGDCVQNITRGKGITTAGVIC